jgi:uncharacterized repeat protein (TIGR01451 family)
MSPSEGNTSAPRRPGGLRRIRVKLTTRALLALVVFGTLAAAAGAFSTVHQFQPSLGAGRIWGGRTVAVDVDPGNPNTALAASESGGLFRTTDDGVHWTHIDTLPPFRMADVKYAPGDRNIVLATASSDSGRKANGGGIWRSTNGGLSWSKPATANPACNARANAWGIAFEPASQNVYVGTDCGVAVSTDRGATWTHVALAQTLGVAAAPGGIVDTCSSDGHHRSTNAGGVFGAATAIGTGGSGGCPGIGVHAIAVSPAEPNVVFAINRAASSAAPNACSSVNAVSLWTLNESDDGGATWNPIGGACPSRPPSVGVRTSTDGTPGHLDLYFSGGLDYYRGVCTSSGGPGLRCSGVLPAAGSPNVTLDHADPSQTVFTTATSGSTLNCAVYIPGDNGVGKSTDCGATFTTTGGGPDGFNALQIYEVTGQVHPGGTDLYFGTQDNDIWASSDNGTTWPNVKCCEGFFFQIPHNSPSSAGQTITGVVCGGCYTFNGSALFGAIPAWNNPLATTPPGCTFSCTANPNGNPFLVEPGVYVEFAQNTPPNQALYITTNTGGAWTKVAMSSPTSPALITGGDLNVQFSGRPYVSGPPGDPTIFQAYSRPVAGNPIGLLRINVSRAPAPPTATVTDVSAGLNSIDSYCNGQGTFVCPTVFGVDPNDPNHLIVADGGSSQIKQSLTGGNSWTVDNQLTNLVTANNAFDFGGQTHVIAFDPSDGTRVLVGTEANGILASLDNGQTWGKMSGSEEVPAISSFFFDEVQHDIVVSSYGRGLWKFGYPASDLKITKTHHPDIAIAGEQLYYDIAVTNTGADPAPAVTVTDTLPVGVTFVTSTDSCAAFGQTVTCPIGDVAPGETKTFTIKVLVNANAIATTGPRSITNIATTGSPGSIEGTPGDNTATDVAIVEDSADLEITKLCKPDTSPAAGDPIDCSIFVDNHGPSDARGVTVLDTLLSNQPFTISLITPSSGTCGAANAVTGGQKFTCNLGVVPAQGRATVTYRVSTNTAQDINNVATVTATTPDPDTSNNKAIVTLTVSAVADLSLTKSAPANVVAGTTMTYTLVAANVGPSSAQNVVVSDNIPAGVTVQSVSAPGATVCNAGTPGDALAPLRCTFSSITTSTPAANRTVTIVVKVKPDTTGVLHNDASVTSDTFDPGLGNNLAHTDTTVDTSADLSVTKLATPNPVVAGRTLSSKITVANAGPSRARNITLTDSLPAGVTFASVSVSNGAGTCTHVTAPSDQVDCQLNDLDPGQSTIVFVDVTVKTSTADGATLTDTATVASSTPDPAAGNNTASQSPTVQAVYDRTVNLSSDAAIYKPSTTIHYLITVGNNGPSDAVGVVVKQTLPPAKFGYLVTQDGGCTGPVAQVLTCPVGTVPVGTTKLIHVNFFVQGSKGTITSTAALNADPHDPVSANDTFTLNVLRK